MGKGENKFDQCGRHTIKNTSEVVPRDQCQVIASTRLWSENKVWSLSGPGVRVVPLASRGPV